MKKPSQINRVYVDTRDQDELCKFLVKYAEDKGVDHTSCLNPGSLWRNPGCVTMQVLSHNKSNLIDGSGYHYWSKQPGASEVSVQEFMRVIDWVAEHAPVKVKLNENNSAIFNEDGKTFNVGCQVFKNSVIDDLIRARTEVFSRLPNPGTVLGVDIETGEEVI